MYFAQETIFRQVAEVKLILKHWSAGNSFNVQRNMLGLSIAASDGNTPSISNALLFVQNLAYDNKQSCT